MIRSKSRLVRFLAGVVALQATACRAGVDIDGPVTGLLVRGVIEDANGTPIQGAIVQVAWRPGSGGCGQLSAAPSVTTVNSGEFETTISEFGTFSQACVQVDAEPPQGLGLAATGVQLGAVPLRQQGLDTLVVRLTLSGP